MKKILWMALILLLCGAACAEGISENAEVMLDLNGDGAMEVLSWHAEAMNEYDEQAVLRITDASGEVTSWASGMLYAVDVYAQDIDGDGLVEIFVSGDEMSDDYITFCMHWQDGVINMLSFPDFSRGDNTDMRYGYGYGMVTALGENSVRLTGSQDVIGTYFGHRMLSIVDGQFELSDGGAWVFERNLKDSEVWEYAALTVANSMVVTLDDGTQAELEPGTKLVITDSDKVSYAGFALQDGRTGILFIAPDVVQGWGMLVNGVPEAELFEYVPYAD